jgi:hypothetical protein
MVWQQWSQRPLGPPPFNTNSSPLPLDVQRDLNNFPREDLGEAANHSAHIRRNTLAEYLIREFLDRALVEVCAPKRLVTVSLLNIERVQQDTVPEKSAG